MSVTKPRPVVPEELPKILHDLSYAVIKNNPQDIISFAVDYFQKLLEEKEKEITDVDAETESAAETAESGETEETTETAESPDAEENSSRNIV